MLECAAKPPVDLAGRPAGADDRTVPFEPNLTRGITGQVAAFGVGEQRTQMQRAGALLDIDVHHHSGVLPVRPVGCLGVPSGLDQAHERLEGAWQRRHGIGCAASIAAILLPVGDQRVTMRRQCRVELRRIQVRKFYSPTSELVAGGLGDRGLRLRPRIGFGSRFQLDRGTQLVDRGAARQLRVVLIRSITRPGRDDADLIQRRSTLSHALRAARERLEPTRDGGDRVGVCR